MECRHELALRRVLRALDEHLMLTKNLQHHLGPLQHHIQRLGETPNFTSILLAPSFYKLCILCSGGWLHGRNSTLRHLDD
jgi:hypothetical protein